MNEPELNEESLREHFQAEIGPIQWKELERFFAQGAVIEVDPVLDLVEVAVKTTLDNASQVKEWLDAGLVRHIEDETAIRLMETNAVVTGVVSRPWIFIKINSY